MIRPIIYQRNDRILCIRAGSSHFFSARAGHGPHFFGPGWPGPMKLCLGPVRAKKICIRANFGPEKSNLMKSTLSN